MDTQANLWTFTDEIQNSIAALEGRNKKVQGILAQVKNNMNLLTKYLSQPAAASTKPSNPSTATTSKPNTRSTRAAATRKTVVTSTPRLKDKTVK